MAFVFRHNKFLTITGLVVAARFLLAVSNSGAAFGRSYGLSGLLAIMGIMVLSVLTAAGVTYLIVARVMANGRRQSLVFGAVTFVLSIFVNFGMFVSADADWELSRHLVTKQVEYFCVANFNRDRCVEKINSCPVCVLDIDRWKRDRISGRLKAYRAQYPKEWQEAVTRQPATNASTR